MYEVRVTITENNAENIQKICDEFDSKGWDCIFHRGNNACKNSPLGISAISFTWNKNEKPEYCDFPNKIEPIAGVEIPKIIYTNWEFTGK